MGSEAVLNGSRPATEAAASSCAATTPNAQSRSSSVQGQRSSALPAREASLSSTPEEVAQAPSEGDVRADKVAALQQSIAAGTYSVPTAEVAARLLSALLN